MVKLLPLKQDQAVKVTLPDMASAHKTIEHPNSHLGNCSHFTTDMNIGELIRHKSICYLRSGISNGSFLTCIHRRAWLLFLCWYQNAMHVQVHVQNVTAYIPLFY